MIQLEHDDFRALEGFEYLQLWTDLKYNVLPALDLAQIRPLIERKAGEVWQYTYMYFNKLYRETIFRSFRPATSSSLFEWTQLIDISRKRMNVVQQFLMTFEPRSDQIVIVMWQPELAAAMPWHLFCTYWDDFCYASGDDVSISPISEAWYLVYHHEDRLLFGRPRLPLLDEASRRPPTVQAKPLIHRDEILRLLQANEKIAAIKLYHQETGMGLKDAVDAVNKLLAELQHSPDQL